MAIEVVQLKIQLPAERDIEPFLGDLLGRKVTVRPGGKLAQGPKDRFVGAAYRAESGTLAGVAAVDLPLAVALGASIAALPPGVATPIVTTGRFTEAVWDNLYEVLNVTSRWFQPQQGTMVAIDRIWQGTELPTEIRGALTAAPKKFEAKVEVQGYGGGMMLLAA